MRLLLVAALAVAACGGTGVLASPTPAPSPQSVVELKYRVFQAVGRPWYCDPDFYPIARADEKDLARQRLPEMQKDTDVWAAILSHNALGAGAALTDDQLLAAYHDWKDLRALELGATGPAGVYGATYLVRPASTAAQQGERVELRIDVRGQLNVLSRQPGGRLNCPICLADTTRIDTPAGPAPVIDLRVGDLVWTIDAQGRRVAAPLVAARGMDAPAGHLVLRITLVDGRSVTASPGHPAADGRTLASLAVGERFDGSAVASIERLPYRGRTYDVLPAGASGLYWAGGVLLASTLR